MARKASGDFNTRVHEVFERIARGETSPRRLSPQELADALEAVERERQRKTAPSDKPAD